MPTSRSRLRWTLLLLLVAVIVYRGVNILRKPYALRKSTILHSEAYKAAVHFVKEDAVIRQQLGEPERVTLSSPGDFTDTSAEMAIGVDGRKRIGIVFLRLQEKDGKWFVSKGKLKLNSDHFLPIR